MSSAGLNGMASGGRSEKGQKRAASYVLRAHVPFVRTCDVRRHVQRAVPQPPRSTSHVKKHVSTSHPGKKHA